MSAGVRGLTDARRVVAFAALLGALAPAPARAQNILTPVDSIERLLRSEPFEIIDRRGSRFEGDRTSRVALTFADGTLIPAKWAPAPIGGEEFNNTPRYEIAAYEIQDLFLTEEELVVPPTVARAVPIERYRELDARAEPTFHNTRSVLVVLQYWLFNVSADDVWDEDRFEADSLYARYFANFNILTYLIRHNDENEGNYLISAVDSNPRVFSVDNGLSFSSEASDRGYRWRTIRVDRLPAATVERLRDVTEEDLMAQLRTVAQFGILPSGHLTPQEPGPSIDDWRGVRRDETRLQLGLTEREIRGIRDRIEDLLEDVDKGRYTLF
ncbi:MAG: hypothetical protein P8177_00285 [Gemmatimonadota bacterium]|jgi:hypothetical protein